MIEHGETGFLANNDSELAHYTAMLAYDEKLRQRIIEAAYPRLADELANPEIIWSQWKSLFESLDKLSQSARTTHANEIRESKVSEVAA